MEFVGKNKNDETARQVPNTPPAVEDSSTPTGTVKETIPDEVITSTDTEEESLTDPPAEPGTTAEKPAEETQISTAAADKSEQQNTEAVPYVSPVDFAALQDLNPDIYAWILIPGTNVNYPVCQREGNDQYYLNHGENGKSNPAGSLYTEATYNKKDFEDPLTVIYGHDLDNGALFGNVQYYFETDEAPEKNGEIIVFLPDKELHYSLYTGTRFTKYHLIEQYRTNSEENNGLFWFIEDITNVHTLSAYVNPNVTPTVEDTFLALSTCLKGDNSKRFIVVGVLDEVIS